MSSSSLWTIKMSCTGLHRATAPRCITTSSGRCEATHALEQCAGGCAGCTAVLLVPVLPLVSPSLPLSYGEPQWLDVDGCQGIQKHKCDLSAVTSDPRERYYGRVSAACLTSSKSVWALSRRFNPRGDTIISPPELRLNVTEDAVVVHVKPPRPLVRKLHHRLLYSIYLIDSSGKEEAFELSCCSDKLTLNHLEASGRYCLQAQILVPLQARSSARSAKTCVALL
ncbi:interleukin-22 receptor subunit alpha-2 isoform X1 [Betta splendens]|uniref:Interleukin-22 receptor subunit alpha-2 isoform X1 n=1 Tax=Betta splendens TaxID=158456 RepID=A0A6P7KM36_BETSP|nr:interleukin-22 receptor subunit alpha-2 isoform X1 [Betta splendens]